MDRSTLGRATGKQYYMQDDDFEWNDAKAIQNWRDHAVKFDTARDVFRDAFAVEWLDDTQDAAERRFVVLGMVEHRVLFVAYILREDRIRIISARKADPHERRRIMTKTAKHNWARFDAMTDEQAHAAALADVDAQPLTNADMTRMRRVPRAKTLRRALGLTQEEFATRYQIPLGTLRDWEQGRAEPDQPARAYLKAIAGDPAAVQRALRSISPSTQ